MSKIEEDFRKQAEQFADETRDTAEDKFQTRHDYLAGCEHGYQYAINKACKWLESMSGYVVCGQKANVNNFRKAMQ